MIIRAITKSSKKVIDKFTVYFYDCSCLTMSSNPDSPQGVSQFGEYRGIYDNDFKTGKIGNEILVNWFDLPIIIQAHIEKRIRVTEGK